MEIALYAFYTCLLWLLSTTVLSPFVLLLLLSKTFSNIWFSFFFSYIILPLFKPQLTPQRQRLFKLLKEELSKRDETIPLKVLEIGIGDGPNLEFYPENSKLTAVDLNPKFESNFLANKKKYPQVELERIVHCMAENMTEIPDNSMDVVVSTYVLCSVTDVEKTLREIKRVLKPGGKYFFMEHVVYQSRGWHYLIQRCVSPLWQIYCNGCVPDRDHKNSMDKAGFKSFSYERYLCTTSVTLYVRPHVVGVASK